MKQWMDLERGGQFKFNSSRVDYGNDVKGAEEVGGQFFGVSFQRNILGRQANFLTWTVGGIRGAMSVSQATILFS